MWRAGICRLARSEELGVRSKDLTPSLLAPRSSLQKGFTLIELLVVLSILSITLSFVVPRLMGREEAELKSSARRLLYTVRQLSDEALFKKEKRVLSIDLDKPAYGDGDGRKRSKLPDGVLIEEVTVGREKIGKGMAFITFFPSGFRDEAEIQLTGRGKGKGFTVVIPALGERFEIRESGKE